MLQFLQYYSKKFPWHIKTLLPDQLLKNHSVKYLLFEEKTQKPNSDNICLFRALELHLHGIERLEEEVAESFNLFPEKAGGTDPANFRGVFLEDTARVEDFEEADIFLYDIEVVDGSLIGKLPRKSVRKRPITKRQLGYNSHLCYVSNIKALFKTYRSPSCDELIKRAQQRKRR